MFEACKVVQYPFNQEIQELDWEMYIRETVAQIVLTHLTICQSRANLTMIAPTPPGHVTDTEDIAVMFVSGHHCHWLEKSDADDLHLLSSKIT